MMKQIIITIGFLLSLASAQYNNYCSTPDSKDGQCIVVKDCEPLFNLLKQRPITTETRDFLRRSQCGFSGSDPKVCCPSSGSGTNTDNDEKSTDEAVNRSNFPEKGECGRALEDRIVGGEATDIGEHPWMALIEYQKPNGKGFYCGGVLISNRYVLTAAHCMKGKDLPKTWRIVSVRLGEYNTATDKDCVNDGFEEICADDPPLDVPVQEQIPHEKYNPLDANQYNDIALLRLSSPVTFSRYIRPICFPTSVDDLSRNYVGVNLTVAGWGRTESKSESDIKLKVNVPVKSLSTCSPVYSRARVTLADGQMCAGGEKGKDSCRGDSGGPLMARNIDKLNDGYFYVVGIVSFGPSPCGMQGWPGVYTNVAKYAHWVAKNMRS